ncbi:DEAD/DEAH box helicase, partial [Paenibacillus apiarius]|nr:DEAD/DEAH box helicase [Paenibacillus apiarius]
MQVNDALMPLGKAVGVFLKTAVGGVPYDRQIDALRRGVEIVVATPGRLGDLIERGVCRLDDVEITVLDEADQMADMGFLPEVTQLLEQVAPGGQRMLFSATLDNDVDTLVKRFMTDPVTHSTAPGTATVSTMDHHLLLIPPHDKFAVAASIAAREGRTMLFARTQLGVDRLVEERRALKAALDDRRSTDDVIRDREELAEQIRALGELKEMAASYGFDISRPAATGAQAIQWLYFEVLRRFREAVTETAGFYNTAGFVDAYLRRDIAEGRLDESGAQELIDDFVIKLRIIRFLR